MFGDFGLCHNDINYTEYQYNYWIILLITENPDCVLPIVTCRNVCATQM